MCCIYIHTCTPLPLSPEKARISLNFWGSESTDVNHRRVPKHDPESPLSSSSRPDVEPCLLRPSLLRDRIAWASRDCVPGRHCQCIRVLMELRQAAQLCRLISGGVLRLRLSASAIYGGCRTSRRTWNFPTCSAASL